MSTAFTLPPAPLAADFDSLEAALRADASGAKAQALDAYFAQAELETRETQLRSTDFETKQMAGLLADCFAASRRVVAAAWARLHGRELAG
jgi:hypothetical protein